jgi:hypothetical protein
VDYYLVFPVKKETIRNIPELFSTTTSVKNDGSSEHMVETIIKSELSGVNGNSIIIRVWGFNGEEPIG